MSATILKFPGLPPIEGVGPVITEIAARDWCRGCGASAAPDFVIAEYHHEWVMDEDDYGYPYCPKCIADYTAEVASWDLGPTTPAED